MLTRRRLIAGAAGMTAAAFAIHGGLRAAAPGLPLPGTAEPRPGRRRSVELVAAERPAALPCFAGKTLPLWTFAEGAPPLILRLDLGDELETVFRNRLPREGEHATIHWHGIRLPNDQDGVPGLVQRPVVPGEDFTYRFAPPDTGTFFFHTHCNTAEQLGRGLVGILVVDGDATMPFDADEVILLRDWRVDLAEGAFQAFSTKRGAGRGGSFGAVRSANGATDPLLPLPSSADCRLRLVNADPSRVLQLAIEGADAAVIAIDGIAVPPFPLDGWLLGPAMRIDVAMRSPAAGAIARLIDRETDPAQSLARFTGTGAPRRKAPFAPLPLRAGRIPPPDPARVERIRFEFTTTRETAPALAMAAADPLVLGEICSATDTFWAINGRAWPGGDHENLPPPLATLRRGGSYLFELHNPTKNRHPIHIHGHTFTVLGSDRRNLPVHHADTVLLLPAERLEVALVADNPGNWMFHCHVLEHQETGMMGYLRVL